MPLLSLDLWFDAAQNNALKDDPPSGHNMKIKLGGWEFQFDKEDAKIVVPLLLLLLGLTLTPLNKIWLWCGAVAYYLLYFFLKPCALGLKSLFGALHHWLTFRCPYCKSREVILQGFQGYHSDEFYGFHLCNRCRETSVLVNARLIKTDPDRAVLKT